MSDPRIRISEYLIGTIDDEGALELAAWIKSNPRNADEFVREALVHSQLGAILRGQSMLRTISDVAARQSIVLSPSRTQPRSSRRIRFIGIAAGLVFAVGISTVMIRHHVDAKRVATVRTVLDAKWNAGGGDSNFVAGSNLESGSYRLNSGLARVDFSEGSQVILQGPASFWVDHRKLHLDSGRAVVTCPTTGSRSFVLETRDARIVNLGTEYGLIASEEQPTQVQVFQGSVQVNPVSVTGHGPTIGMPPTCLVSAGQCWRMGTVSVAEPSGGSSGSSVELIREGEFERETRAAGSDKSAGWAATLGSLRKDPSLIFCSDFNPLWNDKAVANLADPCGLCPEALDPSAGLEFVPGRLSGDQALWFYKRQQALRINVPGKFTGLTLAAWIKLDSEPKGSQRHRGLVMSDGWGGPGQVHWQIKRHGIRLSIFAHSDDEDPRYAASTEILFDGDWHQCVSIIDPGTAGAVPSVAHYIDGNIIYRRRIPQALPLMTLGHCCVGNWIPSPDSLADDRTLGGRIDDLQIWNRPLRADEVGALHQDRGDK